MTKAAQIMSKLAISTNKLKNAYEGSSNVIRKYISGEIDLTARQLAKTERQQITFGDAFVASLPKPALKPSLKVNRINK